MFHGKTDESMTCSYKDSTGIRRALSTDNRLPMATLTLSSVVRLSSGMYAIALMGRKLKMIDS